MNWSDVVRAYAALRPVECSILEELAVAQSSEPWDLMVTITTRDDAAKRRIRLECCGVTDLKLDWRQRSGLSLDVVSITDLSGSGLEGVNYRVSEGEGLFAFYCRQIILTELRMTFSVPSSVATHDPRTA